MCVFEYKTYFRALCEKCVRVEIRCTDFESFIHMSVRSFRLENLRQLDRHHKTMSLHEFSAVEERKRWMHLVCRRDDEPEQVPSWILAITPKCGRGVFATRSIAAGELIFEETPLLIGPIGSDKRASRHCVGCLCTLSSGPSTCPRSCGLPLCGSDCPQIESHQSECDRVLSWRPRFDGSEVNVKVLQLLTSIRALNLDADRLWLLKAMQANESDAVKNSVRKAFTEFHEIPEDLPFLQRTVAVLNTNAFEVTIPTMSIKGLYAMAGQLNHNCIPNTRHTVTGSDHRMQIHACRNIEAGEQISTSYTRILWDTAARRMHLFRTKQFWCDCCRCEDPTELGTYLGALRCQMDQCSGRLLSAAPLDQHSDWKCDQCHCSLAFAKVCQLNAIAMGVLQKEDWRHDGVSSVWSIAEEHRLLKRLLWPSNKLVLEFLLQHLWQTDSNNPSGKYMFNIFDISFNRYFFVLDKLQEKKARFCVTVLDTLTKLGAGECTLKQLLCRELLKLRNINESVADLTRSFE